MSRLAGFDDFVFCPRLRRKFGKQSRCATIPKRESLVRQPELSEKPVIIHCREECTEIEREPDRSFCKFRALKYANDISELSKIRRILKLSGKGVGQ